MDPILYQSAAFKLGFAFAAVALLMGTLKALDWLNGVRFSSVQIEIREAKGTATAIYYGARVLAVAHLIGAALG